MLFQKKPMIIFSHGNSFEAAVYCEFTQHLQARGYAVEAIQKLGHDRAYPVTDNWPHLVRQLADFIHMQVVKTPGQPVFLVGHSLGGFLSLMCAAQFPVIAGVPIQGVVLLDSPIIGGWKAKALRAAKKLRLIQFVSPGAVSQKRKSKWPSTHAAYVHFRAKKNFFAWHNDAVYRYVETFSKEPTGRRRLGFDRSIETAIYNTLPDNLEQILANRPPQCPIAFIGGQQSSELKRVGLKLTKKIARGRVRVVPGSHLFPIENPLGSAAAVDAEILNMAALSWDSQSKKSQP